jgi:hypothetical protein
MPRSLILALLVLACGTPAAPMRRQTRTAAWLKGQLHVHTDRSGDSRTPARDVVRWYREHGYDFIVLTDHNYVTVERGGDRILVAPGVELTQNLQECNPVEPGEPCLLHVNALFAREQDEGRVDLALPSVDRSRVYAMEINAARDMHALAQINHPDFHYSVSADLLLELAHDGANFVEVANEAIDSNNGGDASHPSTEALWDSVLTRGGRIWGTATDDAHHYDDAAALAARGEEVFTGDRGWVMVRAERNLASIRDALEHGRFYSSNGVELSDVRVENGALVVELPASAAEHTFRFISGGRVVSTVRGRRASFDIPQGYLRCVIDGPNDRHAWTQPVWR